MNILHTLSSSYIQLQYSEHVAQLNLTDKLILAYDGILNDITISKLESEIEKKLNDLKLPKQIIKKIFFLSVELIQNQYLYGVEDEKKIKQNYFIISKQGNTIKIIGANLVKNNQINQLIEKINIVNSLKSKRDLKSYYLESLAKNNFGDKGGAGLGIITLAMKSQNQINGQFKQINQNYSIFLLELNVKLKIDSEILKQFLSNKNKNN